MTASVSAAEQTPAAVQDTEGLLLVKPAGGDTVATFRTDVCAETKGDSSTSAAINTNGILISAISHWSDRKYEKRDSANKIVPAVLCDVHQRYLQTIVNKYYSLYCSEAPDFDHPFRAGYKQYFHTVYGENDTAMPEGIRRLSKRQGVAALRRWEALTRFAYDGRLSVNNSWLENLIWPIALDHSNRLFAGNLRADQRAATAMSA